jgi:hypothetical protein
MKKTKFSSRHLGFTATVAVLLIIVSGCSNNKKDSGKLDIAHLENWQILISENAIPEEKYAVREFQHWYREATGINLPLTEEEPDKTKYIVIGDTKTFEGISPVIDTISFGPEDLFIAINQNRIVITGGRPRGALYGVYSFLERYLDIRFLTPEHTHIPKPGKKMVTVPENFTYSPPLQYRLSYYGETLQNPAFAVRLRNNKQISGDGFENLEVNTKLGQVNHSFGRQIPVSKYGAAHPEYFALHDGVRRNKAEFSEAFEVQPCLSNPEVLEIVTESVLRELDENPGRSFVSVAQNDNNYYCECPECAAIDKKEGSQSGSLVKFVNAVADKVAEKHPDVTIGTFAYDYTRVPPKNIRPRENVLIQLCSIECSQIFSIDDSRSPRNKKFVNDVEGWSRICDNINIWTYNTNFFNYLLPCPNLWNIEPNIRFFVKNHAKGIFMQGQGNNTGGSFSDLRNYVTSKLLWNPDLSGEELIDEFLDLHYGSAAPPIKEWLIQLRKSALEKGIVQDKNCFAGFIDYGITPELARAGIEAFEKAIELAGNEEIRSRVEKASIAAYRVAVGDLPFLLSGHEHSKWKKGLWKPEKRVTPETAKRVIPYMRKLVELCEKYEVPRWSEAWTMDEAIEIWSEVFEMEI